MEIFGDKSSLENVTLNEKVLLIATFPTVKIKQSVLAESNRLVFTKPTDFQSKVVRTCLKNLIPLEGLRNLTGSAIYSKYSIICETISGMNFYF